MKQRYILPLNDPLSNLENVGGKGASLARLSNAGLPVPDGFYITTDAYRYFVAENELQEKILLATQRVNISLPATLETASVAISSFFAGAEIPADLASAISAAYMALHPPTPSVAVRSSATAEDLPEASFAGQQESILNVRGEEELLAAVKKCWGSLWTARAIGYRARQNILTESVALAVVVQMLVPADAAGILFTANPVSGEYDQVVINAAWGLGEAVVGGAVTPDTLTVSKPTGRLIRRETGEKQVMTIRIESGTSEQPVPDHLKKAPVLSGRQAAELARLGVKIEKLYNMPMDIEWTLSKGRFAIVQARPITTLNFDENNDSLRGDFVWSNVNVGEAVSDVMTPLNWSVIRDSFKEISVLPGYNMLGNIGGRPYNNISVVVSTLRLARRKVEDFVNEMGGGYEKFQGWIEEISIPLPRMAIFAVLRNAVRVQLRQGKALKEAGRFLSGNVQWCNQMKVRINEIESTQELADFWAMELAVYGMDAFYTVTASALHYSDCAGKLRRDLIRMVGEEDADALLSNVSRESDLLASLGPTVGLWKVYRDHMSRDTYLRQYGHRGPHEGNLLAPGIIDETRWFELQLESFSKAPVDVDELLVKQRAKSETTWNRFQARYPDQAKSMKRRIDKAAKAARLREAVRSEFIRLSTITRACALKAGELTGLGEDIFFLTHEEIDDLLRNQSTPAKWNIAARKKTYESYLSLPVYPTVIRGPFDPFKWASNPNRREDYFDAQEPEARKNEISTNLITGAPGSSGIAEGFVRRLDSVENDANLQAGEILVATQTNIGWTPLFPRAAAVVTDIGAPLSHAAIVARELGIPAVVGCSDATMRLKTGDKVRVDGSNGTVEILERGV
jgi:phosphohistidine swiveling domain-containing protein